MPQWQIGPRGFPKGDSPFGTSCGARLPLVRWRALRLADRCAHHFLPLSAAGSGRKCCLWSVRRGFQRGTHRKGSPWHLLRYPKPAGAAIAAAGFDRCANKSSLHRPPGALRLAAARLHRLHYVRQAVLRPLLPEVSLYRMCCLRPFLAAGILAKSW